MLLPFPNSFSHLSGIPVVLGLLAEEQDLEDGLGLGAQGWRPGGDSAR